MLFNISLYCGASIDDEFVQAVCLYTLRFVLVKECFVWGSHSVKGQEGGGGLGFMFTFINTGGMTSSRTAGRFSFGLCMTATICSKIINAT